MTLANVIRAELFKTFRKRRTYILAGFMWVLIPALLLLVGWILQTRVGGTFVDSDDTFSVNQIVELVASPAAITRNGLLLLGNLSPSLFIIIVSLIAALLIGEERANNMWKTVLTAEPNRVTVLTGKLITAMTVLAVLLAGSYLAGPLFGGIGTLFLPTTFGGNWLELLGLYGLQWLFGLSGVLFAFLIIWFIRNLPLAIVTIFFLPALLEGAYTFYRTVVGFDRLNRFNALLEGLQLQNTFRDLPQYFFTSNLYAPSRWPLSEVASVFGGDTGGADVGGIFSALVNLNLGRSVLVMAVYALLFGVFLFWSFTRSDVS